ncbi:ABC transporter permease subunit [Haladaptatus sp. CMAA 1911]|uniref:ABC transporter permease subunit n=1 Tax=unclassified Haladaptatus TaxID=2622732 RepID=UPI0037550901
MSWIAVAKKDIRDAARSRRLLSLIALFVLFFAGASYFFVKVTNTYEVENANELAIILSLTTPTAIFLPAVGILSGYRSVVGERDSGSLKLLLSLPHTRTDVLLGKFIGRATIVSVATVIGLIASGVVIVALGAPLPIVDYLLFAFLAIFLGASFVSISVGLSAGLSSENIVVAIGFGLVVLFTMLWDILNIVLALGLDYFNIGSQIVQMDIISFINSINPRQAFYAAYTLVNSASQTSTADVFWQQGWFGFVVLLLWLIMPLVFGYWRFTRAELS